MCPGPCWSQPSAQPGPQQELDTYLKANPSSPGPSVLPAFTHTASCPCPRLKATVLSSRPLQGSADSALTSPGRSCFPSSVLPGAQGSRLLVLASAQPLTPPSWAGCRRSAGRACPQAFPNLGGCLRPVPPGVSRVICPAVQVPKELTSPCEPGASREEGQRLWMHTWPCLQCSACRVAGPHPQMSPAGQRTLGRVSRAGQLGPSPTSGHRTSIS